MSLSIRIPVAKMFQNSYLRCKINCKQKELFGVVKFNDVYEVGVSLKNNSYQCAIRYQRGVDRYNVKCETFLANLKSGTWYRWVYVLYMKNLSNEDFTSWTCSFQNKSSNTVYLSKQSKLYIVMALT